MKEVIINNIMLNIKNNKDYTEQKLNEIRYGLEALYLTSTKIAVIYIIAVILNSYKELTLIFLLYGTLRLTGFGIHAKSSKECWISSLLIFVPIPYLLKFIFIPKYINIILSIIGTILLLIYSPADTEKRPLIHKKKRIIYKILTTTISTIYTILNIITKDNILSNIITFSILLEAIIVLPISYKLFGLKYNNYLNYKERRTN
ncbi:MAG: accessory gene regulator B family protein [Tenericutes bacterium]|nr:accessory gene regulator B family protein [Mycoplasmatota bacterium]